MAMTIDVVKDALDVFGSTPVRIVDLTFDASYPAGGYALTAALLGMRNISGVVFLGGNTASAVQNYWFNNETGKVMVGMVGVATAAFADATATTDLHTIKVRALVFGQR